MASRKIKPSQAKYKFHFLLTCGLYGMLRGIVFSSKTPIPSKIHFRDSERYRFGIVFCAVAALIFFGNFDWSTLGRSEQCFNTVGMNLLVALFCSAEAACFLAVPHQESMDLGSQFWIQCKARLTSFTHRVRLFPWSNACPYSPTGMNTFLALQLALAPTNGDCCTSSSF